MATMIENDSTPVEVQGSYVPEKILWRGRQWAVTEFGLEALDGSYSIAAGRLNEDHGDSTWIIHVGRKNWVDKADFATAFMVAIVLHDKARHIEPRFILKDYEVINRPTRSFGAEPR